MLDMVINPEDRFFRVAAHDHSVFPFISDLLSAGMASAKVKILDSSVTLFVEQ